MRSASAAGGQLPDPTRRAPARRRHRAPEPERRRGPGHDRRGEPGAGPARRARRARRRSATGASSGRPWRWPTSWACDWSRQALRAPVRRLGVSDRQLLVLARALSRRPEILILDEPTAALSADEAGRLFDLVPRWSSDGMTVLFVSHKLAEFDRLCRRRGGAAGRRDARRVLPGRRPVLRLADRAHRTVRPFPGRDAAQRRGRWPDRAAAARGAGVRRRPAVRPGPARRTRSPCCSGCWAAARPSCWSGCSARGTVPAGERELGGDTFAPTHPADAVARACTCSRSPATSRRSSRVGRCPSR